MYRLLGKNFKAGFTLLEILVVIVIIAILATLAIPQYRKLVARARAAEAIQTIGDIKSSVLRYYMQYDDIVNADDPNNDDDIESNYDIDIPGDAKFDYTISGNNPSDLAITATPNDTEETLQEYIDYVEYDADQNKDINIFWK